MYKACIFRCLNFSEFLDHLYFLCTSLDNCHELKCTIIGRVNSDHANHFVANQSWQIARETRGLHGRQVSKQTILRHLKERDLQPRRPYVEPKLKASSSPSTPDLELWDATQWRQVLFAVESRL